MSRFKLAELEDDNISVEEEAEDDDSSSAVCVSRGSDSTVDEIVATFPVSKPNEAEDEDEITEITRNNKIAMSLLALPLAVLVL